MTACRCGWMRAVLSRWTSGAAVGAALIGQARAQVAASTTTATTTATTAAASPATGMVQGLVGLVVVVGLIYAAAWLLKRVGPRARSNGIVQVLGGASVGPREKVVVVRFGGETLLLGVASGHVSLLHTAVDNVTAPTGDEPATPRFIDRLRAARSGT